MREQHPPLTVWEEGVVSKLQSFLPVYNQEP